MNFLYIVTATLIDTHSRVFTTSFSSSNGPVANRHSRQSSEREFTTTESILQASPTDSSPQASMARFSPKPNSMRERLNGLYFAVFTPFTNRAVLVVSLFLIAISFTDRSSVATSWYHGIEGIVTMLFVSEVALRLYVMRNGFWESPINIGEAIMCFFCLLVFSVLSVAHHTTRLEHNSLIFLRYSAQLLRLRGLLYGGAAGSSDVVLHSTIEVHAPGQGNNGGFHSGAMNL